MKREEEKIKNLHDRLNSASPYAIGAEGDEVAGQGGRDGSFLLL